MNIKYYFFLIILFYCKTANAKEDFYYHINQYSSFENEIAVNGDIIKIFKSTSIANNVLLNDYGLMSGVKSIEIYTQPKYGEAYFDENNILHYTPNVYYVGDDYLEYKVCNVEGKCGVAGVTIEIQDFDYKPQAINDTINIRQETKTLIDVIENDLFLYDLEISVEIISNLNYGTASVTKENKIELFMSDYFIGYDSLQYKVCDGDNDCDDAFLYISLSNKYDIAKRTQGFSPNGDSKNDFFVINSLDKFSSLKIIVLDKNGKMVFKTDNYDNKWNGEGNIGEYNGIIAPVGVYYYKIEIPELNEVITGYIYLNK